MLGEREVLDGGHQHISRAAMVDVIGVPEESW
jgi:hypothetical protein